MLFKSTGSILLFSIMLLSSCILHEDDRKSMHCGSYCTYMEGRVTTVSGDPVRDAQIKVYWEDIESIPSFGASGTIRSKGSEHTDGEGRYSFKFKVRSGEVDTGEFYLELHADDAFHLCPHEGFYRQDLGSLYNDNTYTYDFTLAYKAFLKLSVLGGENMGPDDRISLTISPQNTSAPVNCGAISNWSDQSSHLVHIVDLPAEVPILISSIITKNGTEIQDQDQLILEPGVTREYEIEF